MTTIEALQVVNTMLKTDATGHQQAGYSFLTDRQRVALAKLVTIATERAFGKNRGSR
jgi:hypothetical protein